MDKKQLSDLILQQLYDAKEQNRHSIHNVESLTKALNEHNNDLSVTEEQVGRAVDYLYERGYVKGEKAFQGSFIFVAITTQGEDIIDSGLNVQEVNRFAMQPQVSTTNTTINGGVNQFAQGNNNKLIQNNHTETADDLFEKLIELLEQHNAGKLADEAKAEKKSGGIRKALAFITKKIADSFSTKAGQELALHVMPFIPKILELLPPQ